MSRRAAAAILVAAALLAAVSCSSSGHPSSPSPTTVPAPLRNVGESVRTFVDTSRPTAANGKAPARPDRTLVTDLLFPTDGVPGAVPIHDARPARAGAPYPLIVFSHGFGSSGLEYRPLLERWAAAGFVVAAPRFPLTSSAAPGGPDAADYVNQPADVSYVITAMLRASARSGDALSGIIDPHEIGVAGHSLGGVTTLGLVANSCCRDARVKGAIVMSGDTVNFPSGTFGYSQSPPILFVHGDADPLVPYESSVDAFNRAHGPKGLLTIDGGGHGAPVDSTGKAFASVVHTTTDFFDAYVRGTASDASRIDGDAVRGATRVLFDPDARTQVTIATTPTTAPPVHHATANVSTGLANGQPVTVQWTDYTPGKTVNVVECSKPNSIDAAACDLKHAVLLHPDKTGSGSATIAVVEGAVGTGACDATHRGCVLVVNDGGSLLPSASVRIAISFAP